MAIQAPSSRFFSEFVAARMRLLLTSLLECAVPFLHFDETGAVVTGSPEAWPLIRRAEDSVLDRLGALARVYGAAGPIMGQPTEFAVPSASGLTLRVTAFPMRAPNSRINLIAVLAKTAPAVDDAPAGRSGGHLPSPSEQWYHDRNLTSREREVATHVATGQPSPLIAERLGISVHTVRRHTERVFTKLGVRSRAELARRIGDLSKDTIAPSILQQ